MRGVLAALFFAAAAAWLAQPRRVRRKPLEPDARYLAGFADAFSQDETPPPMTLPGWWRTPDIGPKKREYSSNVQQSVLGQTYRSDDNPDVLDTSRRIEREAAARAENEADAAARDFRKMLGDVTGLPSNPKGD